MSNVYLVSDGTATKIGKANDIGKRLGQLQISSPSKIKLLGYFKCKTSEEAIVLEKSLHIEYSKYHVRGEWFDLPADGLVRLQNVYTTFEYTDGDIVREVTTRINSMNYTQVVSMIASTPEQGRVLAILMDMLDSSNQLVILNQGKLASNDMLKRILKKLAESDLAIKLETGRYVVNPLIYIGKRTRSNKDRELLQANWKYKKFTSI